VSILTIQKITQQSLQILEKEFDRMYKPKYKMKFVHGKYSIYRSEYRIEWGERRSTTLATRLDRATATGMMKLLEDKND
jgi:hypothetical protein